MAHYNLGMIYLKLRKFELAKASLEKSVQLNPNYLNSNLSLALVLQDLSCLKESEEYLLNALKIKPDSSEAMCNLCSNLRVQKRFDEAEKIIYKAIDLNPDLSEAYVNLGSLNFDLGKTKEALNATRKAIEIDSNSVQAYSNLAGILQSIKKFDEAEISLRKSLEIDSKNLNSILNLGSLLISKYSYKESYETFKNGLTYYPNDNKLNFGLMKVSLSLCTWDDITKDLNWLDAASSYYDPMSIMFLEDDPLYEFERTCLYFNSVHRENQKQILKLKKRNKTRIGYLSNDFYCHSVMFLLARVIELHDKSKFEIYVYDFGIHNNDRMTKRMIDAADQYRVVKDLSNAELVKKVRDDEIDVAIDLMGYTRDNRASIFSNRVAPIQINMQGHPGTTGNDSMDYILADDCLIPEEDEKYYTEKVIRMPGTSQPTDDTLLPSNKVYTREELGFTEDNFVFCCFSKPEKIQRKEFQIWMNLLKQREEGILWLLESNSCSKENLLKEAKESGIDPLRLIFSKKVSIEDHMSRQSCADLELDTFNFSAGTMTSLALTTGLPILTMPGQTFSSRLTASVLKSIGLEDELVATSEKEYEEKALRLSESRSNTIALRERIMDLKKTAPYFSPEKYCRSFEAEIYKLIEAIKVQKH